jgi:hypothetical protein
MQMEATKRVEKPVEGEDEGFMAQFKKSYAAARDGKPLEDTPSTASPIETETGKAGRGTLGTRIFWGIAAVGLVMVIVEKLSSSGLDPAATLISRLGYENLDPKVEMVQHIASCKIEGQPAEYAIVQLSINYLNLGGTNRRWQNPCHRPQDRQGRRNERDCTG